MLLLQHARGVRHAFATHAEHVADQFLRHQDFVPGQAVQAHQQPAAQLLLNRVMPIAHRGLGHLRDQRLGKAEQGSLQRCTPAAEFRAHHARLDAVGARGGLYDRSRRRRFAAHEHADAHYTLVADDRDLSGGAVFHGIQKRNDAAGREVEVRQLTPGLEDRLAQGKRHGLQVGAQPAQVRLRQRREELIRQKGRSGSSHRQAL